MPREDRYGSGTRLYVGHLSSRTRSRDLEHIFSRYGRVRDVDMKRDYAFVEFSDPRDADDARYGLDGRDVDGRRITVEIAKGVPRGPGGGREYSGRGPVPGTGRCFNCGIDGHWARDCKAGDWKNKCYRCGERGHVERDCRNSPKKSSGRGRSYSRSPVRSPRRGRSISRSYSRSRSPVRRERDAERKERRSSRRSYESPEPKRSPSPPSKSRNRSPTPDNDDARERSISPKRERRDRNYTESPEGEVRRSPKSYYESPPPANGGDVSPGPSPRDDDVNDDRADAVAAADDDDRSPPRGSESP